MRLKMKIKGMILILATASLIAIIGGQESLPLPPLDQPGAPGTIQWQAQQAKKQGKKRILISVPIATPLAVNSLEELLSDRTVVVAECIDRRSYIAGRYNIELRSWNKFRLIETLLSGAPAPGPSPKWYFVATFRLISIWTAMSTLY